MASALIPIRQPARSLVVAPRLPDPPKRRGSNPFDADGDMVIDCKVDGCGWHAMGPRAEVDLARREHYRQFHATAGEAVVWGINTPR